MTDPLGSVCFFLSVGIFIGRVSRGVDDLRDGIIRTPLSPMITFQDDPLRVLRAIRFAARFGFALHEVILNAAIAEYVEVWCRSQVNGTLSFLDVLRGGHLVLLRRLVGRIRVLDT